MLSCFHPFPVPSPASIARDRTTHPARAPTVRHHARRLHQPAGAQVHDGEARGPPGGPQPHLRSPYAPRPSHSIPSLLPPFRRQTHVALKAMIKEVDEDNDGKISFREFLLIFRKAANGELQAEGLTAIANSVDVTEVRTRGIASTARGHHLACPGPVGPPASGRLPRAAGLGAAARVRLLLAPAPAPIFPSMPHLTTPTVLLPSATPRSASAAPRTSSSSRPSARPTPPNSRRRLRRSRRPRSARPRRHANERCGEAWEQRGRCPVAAFWWCHSVHTPPVASSHLRLSLPPPPSTHHPPPPRRSLRRRWRTSTRGGQSAGATPLRAYTPARTSDCSPFPNVRNYV